MPDSLGDEALIDGRLGVYAFRAETLEVARNFGDTLTDRDSIPVIGTLGLHFLRHRLLVLDYPNRRFAVVDSQAGLPKSLTDRAKWIPIRYEHGYIYVPLIVGDTTRDDIIYDTGASMFPLLVDTAVWRRLTGRRPNDPRNSVTRGTSWGKQMLYIGAPALNQIRLGEAAVEDYPMVYMSIPDSTAGNRELPPAFPFSGLVGNALLGDNIVLILDLPARRIGVVPPS